MCILDQSSTAWEVNQWLVYMCNTNYVHFNLSMHNLLFNIYRTSRNNEPT
jgi:hypothetical protein